MRPLRYVYPEDLSLIMTPHQNKNFQQIWNLIPSIYMHSNNVLRNIFSHSQDIGMIILHQYTHWPPTHSPAINLNSCTTSFFPLGLQIIICTVPIIILLSVMFPHLQSIALRAKFKKGDQSVSSNRNTSTIQECCHPHEKHPHLSWRKKTGTNSHRCMQSHVYMPQWSAGKCLIAFKLMLKAAHFGHIQKLLQQKRIHKCLSSYFVSKMHLILYCLLFNWAYNTL